MILNYNMIWMKNMFWRFFETLEVGFVGIFVLLKIENELLEIVTSDITFNSENPWQITYPN